MTEKFICIKSATVIQFAFFVIFPDFLFSQIIDNTTFGFADALNVN